MSFLEYIGFKKKSASIARDRLQIIIAQSRTDSSSEEDFLPLLRKEILEVVAKYAKIDIDQVKVDLHRQDNSSVMELNVVLPEKEEVTA
ncbi:MAG: cell division topological specificity factor MinE [Coxiellaceae bacterium]|nr:cell division topological specificity factor MinE [Coxiellaceae bacterium]